MKYKVKIQLACPYGTIEPTTLHITVNESDVAYLFGTTLPLHYAIFKTFVSASTAQRYRKYFSDSDYSFFTVFSVNLIPQF